MSKILRALAGFALIGGLAVGVPTAYAEVEPGGWTAISPGFTVAERGCGKVDGLTFTLTCDKNAKYQRAERWYDSYSSGSRQFEGTFKITSMTGSRISLKQTFMSGKGPYFLLAVEKGGRLYSVEGGQTIASGATVGTKVRVNTVHTVGKDHKVYINGSLKQTIASGGGRFHDKFGAYATASGKGPITVEWSDVHFWKK